MRQLFYVVVLLVALAGQVSGAVEALGIPLIWAIPAVGAPQLSGILVLASAAAKAEKRKGQRTSAIAKVLHRKIRAAVDPTTADIAVAVYDLDEIAVRLADGADYDGLTALIAADLAPARLAADGRIVAGVA